MNEKITIVLALYNPNLHYLKLQLESINKQELKDVKLLICDDYSDNYKEIKNCIIDYIDKIPYELFRNDVNLGCNKTFEFLITKACGDCIAFCDQDDIWYPHKLRVLYETLKSSKSLLVYSDLKIINDNDIVIYESLTDIRKRVKHKKGKDLWKYFIRMNSITGCTILVKSTSAKSAIPFPKNEYIWDQWLSIVTSMQGEISYVNDKLIKYRIHSDNLVGSKNLIGITSKKDYIEKRIIHELTQLKLVNDKVLNDKVLNDKVLNELDKKYKYVVNRLEFMNNPSIKKLIRVLFSYNKDLLLLVFEVLFAYSGDRLSKKIISRIKGSQY